MTAPEPGARPEVTEAMVVAALSVWHSVPGPIELRDDGQAYFSDNGALAFRPCNVSAARAALEAALAAAPPAPVVSEAMVREACDAYATAVTYHVDTTGVVGPEDRRQFMRAALAAALLEMPDARPLKRIADAEAQRDAAEKRRQWAQSRLHFIAWGFRFEDSHDMRPELAGVAAYALNADGVETRLAFVTYAECDGDRDEAERRAIDAAILAEAALARPAGGEVAPIPAYDSALLPETIEAVISMLDDYPQGGADLVSRVRGHLDAALSEHRATLITAPACPSSEVAP